MIMETLISAWNHLESAKNQINNGFSYLAIGTIERAQDIIESHILLHGASRGGDDCPKCSGICQESSSSSSGPSKE